MNNIGIIGYGFVGQAVHSIFENANIIIYDVNKTKYNNQKEILSTDAVFICVPTPSDVNGLIDTHIRVSLDYLVFNDYKGIVIIKSTVTYDVLKKYQNVLNICFNPEFLNQNTFIEDSKNQEIILLGGEYDVTKKVLDLYLNCTYLNSKYEFCTLKEACDFKYTRNLYGAYKVLFWEFIQDTTGNARKMADLYHKFPQGEMSQVGMDGFRGYGGACFPKDTLTWNKEHKHELTHFMIKYNEKLHKI